MAAMCSAIDLFLRNRVITLPERCRNHTLIGLPFNYGLNGFNGW
jgi:hypothetical protein